MENINLKQVFLYKVVEKSILTENEAKVLNALFEKPKTDFFELQAKTGIDGQELSMTALGLVEKKLAIETNGLFSSDFFEVAEKMLEPKKQLIVSSSMA